MLTEAFASSFVRNTAIRIAQSVAASIVFSVLISLLWSGNGFARTGLACFIMFHGAVSPIILGIGPEAERAPRHYVAAYVVNLLIVLLPATVAYKAIYGALLLSYDYFVGLVLYLAMGAVTMIPRLSKARKDAAGRGD